MIALRRRAVFPGMRDSGCSRRKNGGSRARRVRALAGSALAGSVLTIENKLASPHTLASVCRRQQGRRYSKPDAAAAESLRARSPVQPAGFECITLHGNRLLGFIFRPVSARVRQFRRQDHKKAFLLCSLRSFVAILLDSGARSTTPHPPLDNRRQTGACGGHRGPPSTARAQGRSPTGSKRSPHSPACPAASRP